MFNKIKTKEKTVTNNVDGWQVHIRENTIFPGLWEYNVTGPNNNVHVGGGRYYPTFEECAKAGYETASRWALNACLKTQQHPNETKQWSHLAE